MLEKNILREKMRSMLRDFCSDKNARDDESKKICDIFLSSDIYKNSQLICAFCSLPNEIETMLVIEQAIHDGKTIALPRVVPNTSDMDFYLVENSRAFSEQIIPGEYGIREPCACLEKLSVSEIKSHTVFLVPGLAFSKSGARLGRGMSFYDRYLSRVASRLGVANEQSLASESRVASRLDVADGIPLADGQLLADKFSQAGIAFVGFGFPFQIVEEIPCEPHDVKMTHLVGEKIVSCKV